MFRRIVLALLLISLVLLPGAVSAAPNNPINPPCTPVVGEFAFSKFEFTGATTAVGEGTVVWTEGGVTSAGTFAADYFNIVQKGNGVTQLNGAHTITLPGGVVLTSDEILLQQDRNSPLATPEDPVVMRANSRLYILGGEGEYEAATGLLHTHGAFNVSTLEGGIGFKGQVCKS
jgi:hypothetical protein